MYSNQFNVVDDHIVEIRRITVHDFRVSDVEDPDLYAAVPLMEWQESEAGKWIMSHAVDQPEWHRRLDYNSYGHHYAITAKLKAKDYTFWVLKWGTPQHKTVL